MAYVGPGWGHVRPMLGLGRGRDEAKIGQDEANMGQDEGQDGPRWGQHGPRWGQHEANIGHDGAMLAVSLLMSCENCIF